MTNSRLTNIPTLGWIGGLLCASIVIAAVAAPLAPYEPQTLAGFPFQAPNADHWLGTDDLGHDIFSQLVYGARISLLIGLLSALFAVTVGLAVALTAGYFRGLAEIVLMRLVDITLAFPFLPLVIVLAAFWGRTIGVTVLTITAVLWARPALILGAQALKVRNFHHVVAAQAMGATPVYILRRHMLPRLLPLATAQFVRTANVAIFLEAAMAFLGVGDPNRISWGTMLYFANTSNAMLLDAWLWWILPVGFALTATIVGLAFMGHAIEVWADPRLAEPQVFAVEQTGSDAAQDARSAIATSENSRSQQSDPNTLLQVQKLTVWYASNKESTPVVANVGFSIGAGKVVGLVGDSGCGKSTVAMSILRLQQSSFRAVNGALYFQGRNLQTLAAAEMVALRGRELALIPQNALNALNPVYTVLDQVVEVTQLAQYRENAKARAHEILGQVGIPLPQHGVYPHQLSGGMRQRVVIAMAVANEPSLLIADEPTTGLDVVTQAEVLALIMRLRTELGMAILLISHDLPMVRHVADELLVMEAGRIVERSVAP